MADTDNDDRYTVPGLERGLRILAELAVGTLIGLCPAFF